VLPELRQHTLDILVETHPDLRLANKLAREAYALRGQAAKYTRAKPQPGARYAMRQEARELLADARKIEDQVIERILDGAMVICATSTGLDRNILGDRSFEWCIMDEASQSTEPGTWIPLQFARRLVLAGDHFQLPPTVVSTEAAAAGFNVSLLERLVKYIGPQIARRLDVQYRMHTDIMSFSSREFYESSLLAHESVASHLLQDLPGVESNDLTAAPVDFIDTAGASYDEEVEPEGESRLNPLEAELVLRKVQALLDAGIPAADIAVISPYAAQVRLLRERVKQGEVEIDSVDGFQGREKEAVIVTLVRSNRDNEIGFLADVRRMNVALTRARRKLIVIGDSATITAHPFYQRLVNYFESIGAYHSVWEEAI
jgi:ATP-dependent RNA/DNA helicase IGHMBP2